MSGLNVEARRESKFLSVVAAIGDHVSRDVATVDVDAGTEERNEEAASAAAEIKRRLTKLRDGALKES